MTQSLGHTVETEAQCVIFDSKIAYVSGAMIVIYDIQLDQQIKWISHRTHMISAIAVSSKGSLMAVAESLKESYIYIYSLQTDAKIINHPVKTITIKRGTINLMLFS